jgi:hypothetical protein
MLPPRDIFISYQLFDAFSFAVAMSRPGPLDRARSGRACPVCAMLCLSVPKVHDVHQIKASPPLHCLRIAHCTSRRASCVHASSEDWRSHYSDGNSEHKTFEMRKQELKNAAEERMKNILATVRISVLYVSMQSMLAELPFEVLTTTQCGLGVRYPKLSRFSHSMC